MQKYAANANEDSTTSRHVCSSTESNKMGRKTDHRMMQEKNDVNFIRNEYKSQANDERKSH